jgi:hypothetical protein
MELKWNSYRVTFETETTDVATTVFALHADRDCTSCHAEVK